jgi:hypothetical protein
MRAARGPTERQAIQSRCPPILPTRQADQCGNGRRAPRAARGAKPWVAGRNVDRLDLRAAPGGRESLDPPRPNGVGT